MFGLLSKEDLLKGKTSGVDETTLEANAALRSIVRRDDFRTYQQFLTDLAKASGIPTPSREDLARIDRKWKKGSNADWVGRARRARGSRSVLAAPKSAGCGEGRDAVERLRSNLSSRR